MQLFTPMQYLQIDVANAFGLDKSSWTHRLQWFEHNEPRILDETDGMAREAEEPAQFLAAVLAYKAALRGETTGYLCGLDATASGLQLLALLAGCEQSASICNLIDVGSRQDAYTRVYEEVCDQLGTTGSIVRKPLKAALMTHLYGSKAEPKKAFGEDTPELAAFYAAITKLLPGADLLNRDLITLWQPNALVHEWILPDGYDVQIKSMVPVDREVTFLGQSYVVTEYVNQAQESGLSLGANTIHALDGMVVREMNRRCNYDAAHVAALYALLASGKGSKYTLRRKDLDLLRILELYDCTGFMSAVVLEYLDEHNLGHMDNVQGMAVVDLLNSLPASPFKLLCIHDCFKFHANYGNDVRRQYTEILAQLADSNVLSHIASQITGNQVNVKKLSTRLPAMIRNSNYALS